MLASGKFAADSGRALLSFIVVATFALWVTDAQAFAGGGGSKSSNNSSQDTGNSNRGGDRGVTASGLNRDGVVTRNRSGDYEAPVGLVVSDDICTGGKYESC